MEEHKCLNCGLELEFSGTGYGKNDSDLCTECYDRDD